MEMDSRRTAGDAARDFPRPRVLVSRCLGFEACRYDGSVIEDEFVGRLASFADVVPVCPEVSIGLGVPRDPVRLIRAGQGTDMVQPSSGRILTSAVSAFSGEFLAGLGEIDGAVLKSRSPSCGPSDTRIYEGPGAGQPSSVRGAGLFASAILERFRDFPVESEGRLRSFAIREHFLTRIFASAGFRAAEADSRSRGTTGPLVSFHASMKLLLMTMNREEERKLGRLVASPAAPGEILAGYRSGLARAMSRAPRPGPVADALTHAMGFFDEELVPAEKVFFLESVEAYRSGRQPLSVCLGILRAWLARNPRKWLSEQRMFAPYPPDLVDIADSGKGRDAG